MRSEGFLFIFWGSGGWTLVRLQLVVASFSRRFSRRFRDVFRDVNSVSTGKAAKPRSGVAVSLGEAAKPSSLLLLWSMGEAAKPRSFCCAHVAVSMGGSCKTSVSASPLASPCVWGKLQNLRLCLSSGLRFGRRFAPNPKS